jgi:hypothetical protein
MRTLLISGLLLASAAATVIHGARPVKADIKQTEVASSFAAGQVNQGSNQSTDRATIQTTGELQYESEAVATNQPKTNAVAISWDQPSNHLATDVAVRIFDGSSWTDWADLDTADDRKDGTPATKHSGLVLTSNAQQVQYRFHLNGGGQTVAVSNPKLTFIDSTKGPDPTKPSLVSKIFGSKAQAKPDAPRVYSRAEWGCPQPNSSNAWPPNYWSPLQRVMVHHTVTAGNPGNSAAEVRGIWQYHTFTNDWGDIGYHYLVDKNGAIFQGRYYDQAYAEANHAVVEGGHTYGFNDASMGIATLGDFTSQSPTYSLMESVSLIAGYKMAQQGIIPNFTYSDEGVGGNSPDGTPPRGPKTQYRLAGHRDYLSTSCPGGNLYAQLGYIRSRATEYYYKYFYQNQYDYSYQGQGISSGSTTLKPGQTVTYYVDLKNEGDATWSSGGNTPVRLGTSHPLERNSGFADSSWILPHRPATFTQKVTIGTGGAKTTTAATAIAPGEIGRFIFTLKAPDAGGNYNEYFQPVAENYTWFPRDVGFFVPLTVQLETFSYQYLTQTMTVPTTPNTAGNLSVTIRNTGNVDWTKNGNNYTVKLATEQPKDHAGILYASGWQSTTRVGVFSGKAQLDGSGQPVRDGGGNVVFDSGATSIAPGEAAIYNFPVKTPNYLFVGAEYFNFVVEGRTWLPNSGLYWPIDVGRGYHSQYAGQNNPITIVKASNPVGTIYFDFKNTGPYTWDQSGPVHLGTSHAMDRSSIFAALNLGTSGNPALPSGYSNWTAANRTGTFAGKVVNGSLVNSTTIAPNEVARFRFPLDARSVAPGVYREYFQLVADGFLWLEDYGAYQDITVQ